MDCQILHFLCGHVEEFFKLVLKRNRHRRFNLSDENSTPKEEENKSELTEMDEMEPAIDVLFHDNKGLVAPNDADKISQQGFYGERLSDGSLELNPIEVLHLLERKRIILTDDKGNPVSQRDIVNTILPDDADLWVKYLVFRDLRSRGYAVREGIGEGITYRVYARGDKPGFASASQLIYVMREGVPISLMDLDIVTRAASTARKRLVFALVDQNGEVNYYKVDKTELMNRNGDN